jgi:plasmid stability protein
LHPILIRLQGDAEGTLKRLDMCCTLTHDEHMSKMIQIRNVPDEIHRVLKVRAAQAGMTLSDYLLKEMTAVAQRPTVEELIERVRRRGPVQTDEDSALAVRAERDGRG